MRMLVMISVIAALTLAPAASECGPKPKQRQFMRIDKVPRKETRAAPDAAAEHNAPSAAPVGGEVETGPGLKPADYERMYGAPAGERSESAGAIAGQCRWWEQGPQKITVLFQDGTALYAMYQRLDKADMDDADVSQRLAENARGMKWTMIDLVKRAFAMARGPSKDKAMRFSLDMYLWERSDGVLAVYDRDEHVLFVGWIE